MTTEPIKTIGELKRLIAPYPDSAHVGQYLNEAEDGGLWIAGICVQRRADPSTHLDHKGDNPVGAFGPEGLDEMVTLVSAGAWPDEVEPAERVPDELVALRGG